MGCGGSKYQATGEDAPASNTAPPPADTGEKGKESKDKQVEGGDKTRGSELIRALVPDARLGDLLKEVPLLIRLTENERDKLGGAMTEQTFKDGEAVFEQEQAGTKFYIITKGKAKVLRSEGEGKPEVEIGALENGDYFGESALLMSEGKRAATVSADGSLKVLWLEKAKFTELFGEDRFHVKFVKRRIAVSAEDDGQQSRPPPDSAMAPNDAVREKTAKEQELISRAVNNTVLFAGMLDEHKEKVVEEMYRASVKKGETVVTQGQQGYNLYVVTEGEFKVMVADMPKKKGKEEQKIDESKMEEVARRNVGDVFGELALMYNAPRNASVIACEDSVIWKVDRYTFRNIVKNVGRKKLKRYTDFLSKVELLAPLSRRERSKMAEALEEVSFGKDSVVFEQDDEGDAMYIVRKGEVIVSQKDKGSEESKELQRCMPGDYFGERALLTNESRMATVKTVGKVRCLKLDRAAFQLLMGPLESIMKQKIAAQDNGEIMAKSPGIEGRAMDASNDLDKFTYKLSELTRLGTLGRGSFGHVQLVKAPDGKTYALKGVSKQQIVDTHQQDHIMSEKQVMMDLRHPFLIRLFTTYKDKNSLYFLLEPVLGGELFTVLRQRKMFDEPSTMFYAAQIVAAFEYLHSKDTVYRDLKPENLLLDAEGYLKVTDFGFAKKIESKTWTLCGTPDYLSPEIVQGKGHGKGVDWWTLGVLIYEMLASYTPFYQHNQLRMYDKIVRGKFKFPVHFTREAKNIVTGLLQGKPTKRLGVIKGGAQTIKNHPWFDKFDWKLLLEKCYKAPILPEIGGVEDMSNFDTYGDDQEEYGEYEDIGTDWDAAF